MSDHDVTNHARYADWDAAYVLGSLTRSERVEYEAHLEQCARCQVAMGEFAPLPGLLARVDESEALAFLEESPQSPPHPVVSLPRRKRPTRLAIASAALVAAALVLVALLVPTLGGPSSPTAASIALKQTVASPLTASVALTRTTWGTRIEMTCTYAAGYDGSDASYRLYVLDRSGHSWLVSSWHAGPGDVAHTTGSIDLSPADIASVQVRSASGSVLLAGQA